MIKYLKGVAASKGIVTGPCKIITSLSDLSKIKKGDILVTSMTIPDYLPAMSICSAIITDEGGLLCHAAIVSRELNIPCIVATKRATKILKDNQIVIVRANDGIIQLF